MTQTTRRRAPARPRRQPRVAEARFRVDHARLLLVVYTASQKVPEPEPPPELPPEAPDELPEEEPEPDELPAPSRDPDEEPVPV